MMRLSNLPIITLIVVIFSFFGGTRLDAGVYVVDFDEPTAEFLMLEAINTIRYREGLPLLLLDENLATVSRRHSMDMAVRDYFDHFSPSGVNPTDRAHTAGVPNDIYENIGIIRTYGQSVAQVVDSLMRSFMESPQHRSNLLNPNITHLGIGFYQDLDNNNHRLDGEFNPNLNFTGYGTILVTQDFCQRCVRLVEPTQFDGWTHPGEYMTLLLDFADGADEAFLRIVPHDSLTGTFDVPLIRSGRGFKARFAIETEGSFTVAIYANSLSREWYYREHGRLELTVKSRHP